MVCLLVEDLRVLSDSDFKLFWDRIEIFNRRNLTLMLVGACNNKPIPSLDHLVAELFIVERGLNIDNGPLKGDKLAFKKIL
jgi:hypothetical protein